MRQFNVTGLCVPKEDYMVDISSKLDQISDFLYSILILGHRISFKFGNPVIDLAHIFGIIENNNGFVKISNRIFETLIYEYFLSIEQTRAGKRMIEGVLDSDVAFHGRFNMQLCLEKFAAHYQEMFCERDTEFLERHGRMLFFVLSEKNYPERFISVLTRIIGAGYWAMMASAVSRGIPSATDCAKRILSKGSL